MIKKPEGQQHHGNLKEALVLAGLEILEEDGLAGLSLRKCAARAGVSHAAPAHHFDGLAGLKSAIMTRAYAVFEGSMLAGIAEAGPNPIDRVKGICLGYIRFATEHEALFNLIFVRPDTLPPDQEREAASARARQVLIDTCADVKIPSIDPNAIEIAVFSLAHGYSKLIEIGRIAPGSGDFRDVAFEDVFSIFSLREKTET